MTERMIFSFTPNKSDYIKATRAFTLHHRSTQVAIILSLLAVLAILLSVIYLHRLSLAEFAVLLAMVIYYIAIFFLGPANVADKAAKDERLRSPMTWEVDEAQALVCTPSTDITCDWDSFGETYETSEYFLITSVTDRNMFQLIPKRAFKTEETLGQFRKLLEVKTPHVTHISAVNLPEFSRNFSLVVLYSILVLFIIIVAAYGLSHGMRG